jgi:hypothetical protein
MGKTTIWVMVLTVASICVSGSAFARKGTVYFNDGSSEQGDISFGTVDFPAIVGNDVYRVNWSEVQQIEMLKVEPDTPPPGSSSCFGRTPIPIVRVQTTTGRTSEFEAGSGTMNSYEKSGSFCYTTVEVINPITGQPARKLYSWINHVRACTDYPGDKKICGYSPQGQGGRSIKRIEFIGR